MVGSQIAEQRLKEADEKVDGSQIVQVSKKIGDVWQYMATLLDSALFDVATMDDIKTHEENKSAQAHRMLCKWTEACGDGATRGKLIKAMCENEKRKQAEEIFGANLVQSVLNSK